MASSLSNNLMPGCKWNEMGEALKRDTIAIVDEGGDSFGKRHPLGH
jgi:hypothetical protein